MRICRFYFPLLEHEIYSRYLPLIVAITFQQTSRLNLNMDGTGITFYLRLNVNCKGVVSKKNSELIAFIFFFIYILIAAFTFYALFAEPGSAYFTRFFDFFWKQLTIFIIFIGAYHIYNMFIFKNYDSYHIWRKIFQQTLLVVINSY